MKYSAYIFLLVLTIFACSDDSTSPDNNGNGNGPDPVASETIGTDGGIVAAQNISVTVPAGSFSADATIGISESSENGYGDNAASKTYLLSGIPENFTAPLSLTLAYTGELTNDTFLVVEEAMEDPLTGQTVRVPRFIPVTTTGDSVTGVIPSHGLLPAKIAVRTDEKDILDFYITVVTDYYAEQNSSHFSIHVPHHANSVAAALRPHLDKTYNDFTALGFDFSLAGNVYGVLDTIGVYTEDDVIDPPLSENLWPKNAFGPVLQIEEGYLSSSYLDLLKFDSIRSLAVITGFYYTPSFDRRPVVWFDIAVGDWLARTWTDDAAEIPSELANNPLAVFTGIPVLAETTETAYDAFIDKSRCFLPLISYLDGEYNFTGAEHTLARIYDERYGGADLATSIETVTGLEPTEWWPDFVQAYITGETGSADPGVFLGNSAQEGQITLSTSDTSHVFSGQFGDLDADIYKIILDWEYVEKVDALQFTAESSGLQDEYLELLLFGVRNNKPYYIGRGIDSVIADAGEASDGNTFLAVVTSNLIEYPYRDDVNYTIEVTGVSTGEYSELVLQLPYVWRSQELVKPDGTTENAGGSGGIMTWSLLDFEKNGDTYTGTKITTANSDFWGHYKKTATITATITPTMASANITEVTEDYDYDTVTTETFAFWNLPLIETAEYYLVSYGSTLEQYLSEEHWPYFTYTLYTESREIPSAYYREREYYARGANIHLR